VSTESGLAHLLLARWTEPSRTGSLIITVFGDAVAPRGGEMALSALIGLLAGLGIGAGVVRTAISRLTADGWLEGAKSGRLSFYRLTDRSRAEFAAAEPRIYGPLGRSWDGKLRLAFPPQGADRSSLEHAGFAVLAPGVLAAPDGAPDTLHLVAAGAPEALQALAARAWPIEKLGSLYAAFIQRFAVLAGTASSLPPQEAMPARALLIHDYRRIVLRDPRLPAGLLPAPWPGEAARALCAELYAALAPASERWLDAVQNKSGPLPRGPDPKRRFARSPAGRGQG
jgi:phenylacetic acid degradation operon negative regulatory protein